MNGLGGRVRKPRDSAAVAVVAAGDTPAVPGRPSAERAVLVAIDADDAGQRLDNFLVRKAKGVPKSHLYRVVRSGEVRVNGRRADASQKLVDGDVVRLPPMRTAERTASDAPRPERTTALPIVHEDDALLVVDKPAGVAVHGGSGVSFGVIEQLRAARPDARFLELAHRLDRDTSGLLIVAKKRAALVALHEALREGRVRKRYLALAAGAWDGGRRETKAPLAKFLLPDGERRVRVASRDDAQGLAAHTVFHPVERFVRGDDAYTLVDVELRTGRTHQIRVHLAHLGHPIVGDDKYGDYAISHRAARGDGPGRPGFKRMFLHAARLAFDHPTTGAKVALSAPLPADCAAFLDGLRAGAAP